MVLLPLSKPHFAWLPRVNEMAQLISVNIYMLIILGLCKDGGNSCLGLLCNTRGLLLLGKYSLAIYLLHDPIFRLFIFQLSWSQEEFLTVVVAAGLTMFAAVILTDLVELPFRNWMRERKKINISTEQNVVLLYNI